MDFHVKTVFNKHDSNYLKEKNVLEREKQEALQINQYKELYKMEKVKREEEEHEKDRERQLKKDEYIRNE